MSLPLVAPTPTPTLSTETDDINSVFKDYYSYRITIPHDRVSDVTRITYEHSRDSILFLHFGDREVPNEHFHILIPTEDLKLADRVKVQFTRFFNKKGNEFHAGKYWHNGIVSAISYCKHGVRPDTPPIFENETYRYLLRVAPTFVKKVEDPISVTKFGEPRKIRERLGEHVLTVGNLLKQASKNSFGENRLDRIILKMCTTGGYVPSRDLMTNGVPVEMYELWEHRHNRNPVPMHWHRPHDRSEKKKEWSDKVTYSRYND